MYCGKCGKPNPEDSIFCQSCGSKIVKTSVENKARNQEEAKISPNDKEVVPADKKVKSGLTGWLAIVGFSLIVTPIYEGYSLLGYFPLLNQTYNIPGYTTLLRFEFVALFAILIAGIYLLFLYFKKNIKFPKSYIIFQISVVAYVILDYLFLASLTAPTQEQQKVISDTLSQNSSNITRSIIFGIIWILYMKKSKKVKATFVKE